FRAAWAAGNGSDPAAGPPRADDVDRVLHGERLDHDAGKRTFETVLSSLPDGTLVEWNGRPHLVAPGRLLPWSFAGYGPGVVPPAAAVVRVLTPPSTVAAIRAGFAPRLHPSAREGKGAR